MADDTRRPNTLDAFLERPGNRRSALREMGAAVGWALPSLAACQRPETPAASSASLAPDAGSSNKASTPVAGPAASGWAVGANIGVVDWAPSPFVDVVKSSRGFGKPDDWQENFTMARDAQGWPAEPSRIVITSAHDRPGTAWPTGTWKGRFRGRGNLVASPAGNGSIANVVRKGDVVTFDWNVTGTPFLSLAFDGAISDLRLVRPGFDLDAHPLLHPQALDYYKQFHTLRFLDFMGQNDSEDQGEVNWAGRQAAGKWHGRKSWEAMAEFFNACHQAAGSRVRGAWWNIPYRFAEDDCLALGRLLKTLLPARALKFPELSNELWNSGYGGKWKHFHTRANDAKNPDFQVLNTPAANEWQRMSRLWALQTARMARAMKLAFPDEFGVTLFPVAAGHFHGIHWHRDEVLPWLSQPPQLAQFKGPPKTYIGTLSAAPYLSGSAEQLDRAADAASLVSGLEKGFEGSLEKTRELLKAWKQLQLRHGIARLDAYEWQLHTHGAANAKVKMEANFAPAAGTLVTSLAHAMRDAGFQLMCFLTAMPQSPVVTQVDSFLWPLSTDFSLDSTSKGRAVRALIEASGP